MYCLQRLFIKNNFKKFAGPNDVVVIHNEILWKDTKKGSETYFNNALLGTNLVCSLLGEILGTHQVISKLAMPGVLYQKNRGDHSNAYNFVTKANTHKKFV